MTEPKSILFTCCECGKETTEVYPAYNHPEAPPICFDCLSDEEKEQLNKPCKVKEATDVKE